MTHLAGSVRIVRVMSQPTRRLVVGSAGAGSRAIGEAAAILAAGGLVAFPTETVYGVGANANDRAALERLAALKQRPPDKPFSIHIADRKELARYVERVPFVGAKLADRFWPGPLTIVFGRGDGAVGVRLPAHEVARAFLRACGVPVVAPSANLGGERPASSANEVLEVMDGRIDAVLDGGAAPLAQSSTVVRVWSNGWEFLREGIISEAMIRRALKMNILFVCTGNSCRSPIAEALCRQVLARRLEVRESDLPALGYEVASAGTAAVGGGRASQSAIAAGAEAGLNLSRHRTQPLTLELLSDANKVYVMSESHAATARDLCPSAAGKIELLAPGGEEIIDPVGFPPEDFERVIAHIRTCVEKRSEEL